MAANRDEPGVPRRPVVDRNTRPLARTELTEALAELRRLIQDPSLDRLERTLADLGQGPTESNVGVDTVRKLRHWSAGHQRVAIELETAARCCRLVEREISQRVDELLAGQKEALSTAPEYFADTPPTDISPLTSLANRLREIFRRSADPRLSAETEPAAGELSIDRFAKPSAPLPIADV